MLCRCPTRLKTVPCTEASPAANSWCMESWRQRHIVLALCHKVQNMLCKDLLGKADLVKLEVLAVCDTGHIHACPRDEHRRESVTVWRA